MVIFWFYNSFFINRLECFYKDPSHINYLATWEDRINVYFFIHIFEITS